MALFVLFILLFIIDILYGLIYKPFQYYMFIITMLLHIIINNV